jgi:hypothetical protein
VDEFLNRLDAALERLMTLMESAVSYAADELTLRAEKIYEFLRHVVVNLGLFSWTLAKLRVVCLAMAFIGSFGEEALIASNHITLRIVGSLIFLAAGFGLLLLIAEVAIVLLRSVSWLNRLDEVKIVLIVNLFLLSFMSISLFTMPNGVYLLPFELILFGTFTELARGHSLPIALASRSQSRRTRRVFPVAALADVAAVIGIYVWARWLPGYTFQSELLGVTSSLLTYPLIPGP